MKKKYLLTGLLAFAGVAGLTSCDNIGGNITDVVAEAQLVSSIAITGQTTTFSVGDTFAAGDLAATVTYSDGTTESITLTTDGVTISAPETFTSVGSYAVILSYKGYSVSYQVTVTGADNVQTLTGVTADVSGVKSRYNVGEDFSYEGLALYETYDNSTTDVDSVVRVTDLTAYTVEILDDFDQAVTSFTQSGNYTVNVTHKTIDNVKTTYNVTVGLYEVNEAYLSGIENASKVNKVTSIHDTYNQKFDGRFEKQSTENMEVTFGNNYTQVKTGEGDEVEYTHYEMLNDNISATTTDSEGTVEPETDTLNEGLMNGLAYSGFDTDMLYGVDNLVKYYYENALENKNNDLEEILYQVNSGDSSYYMYGFTFGYISPETVRTRYFYQVSVKFSLNEDGSFNKVLIEKDRYTSANYTISEAGIVSLTDNAEVGVMDHFEFTQSCGERDLTNEYSAVTLKYESFSVKLVDGDAVANGATLNQPYNERLALEIVNGGTNDISTIIDPILVSINGSEYTKSVFSSTYNIYAGNITIYGEEENTTYQGANLTFYIPGTYNVSIKTENCEYSFTVVVPVPNPTAISGSYLLENLSNPDLSAFVSVDGSITNTVNTPLYLNSSVTPAVANAAFTATLVDSDADATLEEKTIKLNDTDVKVYEFKATKAGYYAIEIKSTADPTVSRTIIINSIEEPTLASVLSGKYGDDEELSVEFTPAADNNGGSLKITYVPWFGDDIVIDATYTYDEDGKLTVVYEPTEAQTGYTFTLSLNADYTLNISYNFGGNRGNDNLEKYLASVTVPVQVRGNYTTEAGDTVKVDENTVLVNGATCRVVGITKDYMIYKLATGTDILYYTDDTITTSTNVVYTKAPAPTLPEAYQGVFRNSFNEAWTLTANGLYDGWYNYELVSASGNTYNFIDPTYPSSYLVLVFTSDSHFTVDMYNDGTNIVEFNKPSQETPSAGTTNIDKVLPAWYGTYVSGDDTIIISATAITINGEVLPSIASVTDGSKQDPVSNSYIYINMAVSIIINTDGSLSYQMQTYNKNVIFAESLRENTYMSSTTTVITSTSSFTLNGTVYTLTNNTGSTYTGKDSKGNIVTLEFNEDGSLTIAKYEDLVYSLAPLALVGTYTNQFQINLTVSYTTVTVEGDTYDIVSVSETEIKFHLYIENWLDEIDSITITDDGTLVYGDGIYTK